MLLKGGVLQQQPLQGGVLQQGNGSSGGTTNPLSGGGGSPWGMIAQAIENKRDRISQQLMNLGNNYANIAMAANSYRPNYSPVTMQAFQPQNMQSNLYSYLVR